MTEYRKINFKLNEFPSCCGVGIVHQFIYATDQYDWSTKPPKRVPPPSFTTREEQFKDLDNRINTEMENRRQGFLEDEDDELSAYYHHLQMILVTEYEDGGSEEIPGMCEYFQNNGWKITKVFTNPKTKNRLTMLEKVYA